MTRLQPLTPEPIRETRYQDRAVEARRHLRLRDRRRRSRDAAQQERAVEPRPGNRAMKKRFFRIDYNGTPRHVIEAADGGPWRLLEGELFGSLRGGRRGRARRAPRPRAGDAVEDRLHRPQLQGSRGGAGQAAAEEPLMFIKPSTSVIGPGDAILLPDGHRPRRSRGGGRRRHRPARAPRQRGGRARTTSSG